MVQRVLLGPPTTFRNGHRTWLYLGYILVIVAVLAASALGVESK